MKVVNGKPALTGGRDFGYLVLVDCETGDLLLVSPSGGPVIATFFGGTARQDPGDNGLTACGDRTRNVDGTENHIPGVSLATDPDHEATAGSPIPHLPCHIAVKIFNPHNGRSVVAPKIDEGPAYIAPEDRGPDGEGHAIDCTRKTWEDLGLAYGLGVAQVDVRIIGGARHLGAAARAALADAGYTLPDGF